MLVQWTSKNVSLSHIKIICLGTESIDILQWVSVDLLPLFFLDRRIHIHRLYCQQAGLEPLQSSRNRSRAIVIDRRIDEEADHGDGHL